LRRLVDRAFAHAATRYTFGLAMVASAFGLRLLLSPWTGKGAPFVLFFGATLVTSLLAGVGPGLMVLILSLPIAAITFAIPAGATGNQAAFQSLLYAVDGAIIIRLTQLVQVARRRLERANCELGNAAGELRGSEARAREMIELSPDAFFLADLDAHFIDVNQAACRMLGYERAELIGKTIMDIIPPADASRLATTRSALLVPGRMERAEWTHVRKDGTPIPVEVSANILPGGRWQAFVRDISERKRREDERQLFVSLLENSSDFIGIAEPDGTPIYVNPAGRRMVGLPFDTPVERTQILEYYPPEERAFAEEVILTSVLTHGRWSGETHFRHWRTGEAIPVSDEHFMIFDPTGRRLLGMGTVTRDISEARRAAREREELLAREQAARHQAEIANRQLRESEERFRLTIDEAPIGMALVALDGRFVRVNSVLCEIVGYTAEELRERRFQDITHPDDLDSDLALSVRLALGQIPRYQLEKRYIRKDGRTVPILLSASILRGHDGAPLYYIAQIEDITERKRSEEAVRFSEAKFSGIVSLSADAIVSVDEHQRITVFNAGAEAIFGYTQDEALGAPLGLLIPERLRERHHKDVTSFTAGRGAARTMGERSAAIWGRRKNGDEFPAEASISNLRVGDAKFSTVVLRDITEQKRLEREQRILAEVGVALAASLDYERTLTTVAEIAVKDFADWCIVELAETPTGLRRLKVVSADPAKVGAAERLEHFQLDRERPYLMKPTVESHQPSLIGRVTAAQVEASAQSREHLEALRALEPTSMMSVPLLFRDQLLGTLTFISSKPFRSYGAADLRLAVALAERAALAIENARLYRAALHATGLRDQVLGVVAHDLRNPLNAISLQAAALQRSKPQPERRTQRPREAIERAARRMNRLIQDLLDVAVLENGRLSVERAPLPVDELVREAVDAQRALAQASSIDLSQEVALGVPDIAGDHDRLLQVFENLIGNALKFTEAGGRVTVGVVRGESEAVFWVADTGRGLTTEEIGRVFDRFWQASARSGRLGAGLGLPITKGIVEAHGGRIWVESAPGRGSTFFFSIPSVSPSEAHAADVMH
jgi:PAS domain S-box-containing protein